MLGHKVELFKGVALLEEVCHCGGRFDASSMLKPYPVGQFHPDNNGLNV